MYLLLAKDYDFLFFFKLIKSLKKKLLLLHNTEIELCCWRLSSHIAESYAAARGMGQKHPSRGNPVPAQQDFSRSSALPAWLSLASTFTQAATGRYWGPTASPPDFSHIYNTALVGAEKGQPVHRSHHSAKGSHKPPFLLPLQLDII